ncbi:725_t:CDS:2, partial [Rhizophagus irregularis]
MKLWSQFLCSSSQKYSCFEQNLSEEDFLSECKELKSVSLSFGSLVIYAQKGLSLCGSWFLAALRKRQVFGSLQFFMGGQWFLVLVAFREKVFCSLRARKFLVEVINDLRSENPTPMQQSINTESEERVTRTVL